MKICVDRDRQKTLAWGRVDGLLWTAMHVDNVVVLSVTVPAVCIQQMSGVPAELCYPRPHDDYVTCATTVRSWDSTVGCIVCTYGRMTQWDRTPTYWVEAGWLPASSAYHVPNSVCRVSESMFYDRLQLAAGYLCWQIDGVYMPTWRVRRSNRQYQFNGR